MSVDATKWVWKLTKDQVTSTEKLILLAIADRCGEEGECWPSISRLVRDTGYHRDAVIQNRKSLIEKGIIAFTGEFRGKSKQIPIMKLMCDDWRKGDITDNEIDSEFDQSSKTTGRLNPLVQVVQNDTYQSSRTTQNLKEEPKRLIKNISTSHEVSLHEKKTEEQSESYKNNNQTEEHVGEEKDIEVVMLFTGSDYHKNQIKKESQLNKKEQFGIKNILECNHFQIPKEVIEDWITNRKRMKKAITHTAWNRLNKELAKCEEGGVDPIDAFETMVARGWQSLKAEWFHNQNKTTGWDVDSVMRA